MCGWCVHVAGIDGVRWSRVLRHRRWHQDGARGPVHRGGRKTRVASINGSALVPYIRNYTPWMNLPGSQDTHTERRRPQQPPVHAACIGERQPACLWLKSSLCRDAGRRPALLAQPLGDEVDPLGIHAEVGVAHARRRARGDLRARARRTVGGGSRSGRRVALRSAQLWAAYKYASWVFERGSPHIGVLHADLEVVDEGLAAVEELGEVARARRLELEGREAVVDQGVGR